MSKRRRQLTIEISKESKQISPGILKVSNKFKYQQTSTAMVCVMIQVHKYLEL